MVRLVLLLFAVVVSTVAAGQGDAHSARHSVDGDLTIVAKRPGHLRLHLPTPQRLAEEGGGIEVDGAGRFIGVIIDRVLEKHGEGGGATLTIASFGHCTAKGCRPKQPRHTFSLLEGATGGVLPAGAYDLYVIADHAEVRVTIDFLERSKHSVLDNGWSYLSAEVSTIGDSLFPLGGPVFSGGSETGLLGDGMFLFEVWFEQKHAPVGALGTCIYWDDPPTGPAGYAPGCEGPDDGTILVSPGSEASPAVASISTRPAPAAAGGWFVAPALAGTGGATMVVVDFPEGP